MKQFLINMAIKLFLNSKKVIEVLNRARLFLAGKKLYIVGLGMIIAAVLQWMNDSDTSQLIRSILEAFAVITGRAAIGKINGNGILKP